MRSWSGFQKGVNLGGWLSQCNHTKERYDHFIGEEDIKILASWGLDHLRVPVDYDLVETKEGDYKEDGFAYIQKVINWCEKYHLHMILDLHKTFGYSFDDGECEAGFFENEKYQERFYLLWEQFAKRFGKYYDRVAFELLNEITLPAYCDAWNRIADTCIGRIRKIVPEVTILVGGYWNNSVSSVKDIKLSCYDNIILNFHCYEPFVFTHQGAGWISAMPKDFRISFPVEKDIYLENCKKIFPDMAEGFRMAMGEEKICSSNYFENLFAEAIAYAEEKDVPLYCGEYGVINLADPESTLKWYEAIQPVLRKYEIGHAAWSYKEMDFGLIDDHMKSVIEHVKEKITK